VRFTGRFYPGSALAILGGQMSGARCLWFAGPRRVDIVAEELSPLEDGQVLVRTTFSGISAGTELLAYRGELDPEMPLDATIGSLGGTFTYPFRYGYSCVGVVEASRSEMAEGTTVFAFQPHQDRFAAAASDVVPLGSVDHRAATLFPLVETALQISLDAGPVLGDEVVVFGLGTVGLLTSLLLGRAGADVTAIEPRLWRRELAGDLGVRAVDPSEVDRRDVALAIEASGRPEVLPAALPLLAHEGTVLVASWYGTKPVTLQLGDEFHRRRLTIRSTQVSTIPARLADRWTVERRRQAAAELLTELPVAALATHTFPFADAAEAYAALDAGSTGLMHVALGY
jgi:2-desacetyl-2-hydroxyethyl bacteriochlorophyllide A dehydrogenase